MAHELEIGADGQANMFFAGETPWHGLGVRVEDVLTADEAITAAGLDWEVEKRPVYTTDGAGNHIMIPNRFSNVRTSDDKSLGIIGGDYNIVQNRDAFGFFDTIVDSGEAKYETAGSLFGGTKIWLTAQVGDTMQVCGEDHKIFLLLSNTHDGSRAFTAATTFIRVVCNNTETMALAGAKTKWTMTHKSTLEGKASEAREALEMTFKVADRFEQEVEKLMQVQVDADKFREIITREGFLPAQKRQRDKNVDTLMAIFEGETTIVDTDAKGTGWGAYNAVTFWLDHKKESRSAEGKMISQLDGQGLSLRSKAHQMILATV